MDKYGIAFEYLLKAVRPNKLVKQLKTLASNFEDLDFSKYPEADLINASYTLPFCLPEQFPHLWQKIISHLKVRGIFSGHLFDDKHSWSKNESMNFHCKMSVLHLFDGLDIL